jgi:hypothetical protein
MKRGLMALALFPGLWLVAIFFWHSNSNDALSEIGVVLGCIMVGVVSGVLSLSFYRPRWGRLAILAYVVLLPVVVAVGSWYGVQQGIYEPNPIGDASDRDWGKNNCWTDDFVQRKDADGFIAAARASICDLGFGVDDKTFYVFIHKHGESNSRENLVFRFNAIYENTPPPFVEWISPSRLRIGYAADVSPVTERISNLHGIAIEYKPKQAYGAFADAYPTFRINPPKGGMYFMTFDLLPLPERAPTQPFAQTGEYSIFGCDQELREISAPAFRGLERIRQRLEMTNSASGQYPKQMPSTTIRGVAYSDESKDPKLVPSNKIPGLRVIYHHLAGSYALELGFPDLQEGYQSPTEHYDSSPATAFVSCSGVHVGTKNDVLRAGGFVKVERYVEPPLLFTPRLGVYTYTQ